MPATIVHLAQPGCSWRELPADLYGSAGRPGVEPRGDGSRYPGATVEPLKYHDDLWRVPGRGGLAADGIRTNEQRYGLVMNLRGVRRPQFTVDRNRLRQWDREWIAAEVQASLPELQGWAGLTLGWLWRVTQESPTIAPRPSCSSRSRGPPVRLATR